MLHQKSCAKNVYPNSPLITQCTCVPGFSTPEDRSFEGEETKEQKERREAREQKHLNEVHADGSRCHCETLPTQNNWDIDKLKSQAREIGEIKEPELNVEHIRRLAREIAKHEEPEKREPWEDEFNKLVRDITQAGFMAKSEARERLGNIIAAARADERRRVREERTKIKLGSDLILLGKIDFETVKLNIDLNGYKLKIVDELLHDFSNPDNCAKCKSYPDYPKERWDGGDVLI